MNESENRLYKQIAEEISAGKFSPAPRAKACEKSQGDEKLAKSLYVKFRFEEISQETGKEEPSSKSRKREWRKECSDFFGLPSPQLISLLILLGLLILAGSCMGIFR